MKISRLPHNPRFALILPFPSFTTIILDDFQHFQRYCIQNSLIKFFHFHLHVEPFKHYLRLNPSQVPTRQTRAKKYHFNVTMIIIVRFEQTNLSINIIFENTHNIQKGTWHGIIIILGSISSATRSLIWRVSYRGNI